MNIGLFEDGGYRRLLPLTWTRACFELRCGVDRLIDKLQTHVGPVQRIWVRDVLRDVLRDRIDCARPKADEPWCLMNARLMVTGDLAVPELGHAWRHNNTLLAATLRPEEIQDLDAELFLDAGAVTERFGNLPTRPAPDSVRLIEYPWDLFLANAEELRRQCRAGGTVEGMVHAGAHLVNPGAIRIAAGAVIKPAAVLDAEDGPILIDKGAQVASSAVLEGPCYIGPGTLVRPGAVIRGGSSVGPVCKVGGEIEASIIHGYSNKQHDGFVGHSYIGQWVNLGAGTITSDLKNTYGTIRVSINGVGVESGKHFIGSIIADHAKTGIGTILPTGCVVGVAANVFTRNVVPKFVPSFAWLTEAGLTNYRIAKAIDIARIVMARRDVELGGAEQRLIECTAELARDVEAAGWA